MSLRRTYCEPTARELAARPIATLRSFVNNLVHRSKDVVGKLHLLHSTDGLGLLTDVMLEPRSTVGDDNTEHLFRATRQLEHVPLPQPCDQQ